MEKPPILLEQIINISNSPCYRFSTSPEISRKELKTFFSDITTILKGLDPEINSVSKIYYNIHSQCSIWSILFPFKIHIMDKFLQVRKDPLKDTKDGNVIRTYNIEYERIPYKVSEQSKEWMKDNLYKDTVLFEPNITIDTVGHPFNPDALISRLKEQSYIGMSDKYTIFVFDPEKVKSMNNPALDWAPPLFYNGRSDKN